MNGFKGQRIFRNETFDATTIRNRVQIPNVPLPDEENTPNKFPGEPGRMVYNPIGRSLHYSDGSGWLKLTPSTGGGVTGFMFGKSNSLGIPSGFNIQLSGWTTTLSPTYVSTPEWDLVNGVYTASTNIQLNIVISIAWSNIPNIGSRVLNIEYKPSSSSTFSPIKQTIKQPTGDNSINVPQECSACLTLSAGDSIRFTVLQDSGSILTVYQGIRTTISGFQSLIGS